MYNMYMYKRSPFMPPLIDFSSCSCLVGCEACVNNGLVMMFLKRVLSAHSFSTYAKSSEKQTFLTNCVCIRGQEMLVFRKVLCTY